MLVACRLAGLSALEAYYAGGRAARNGGGRAANCGTLFRPLNATAREVRAGKRRAVPSIAPEAPAKAIVPKLGRCAACSSG